MSRAVGLIVDVVLFGLLVVGIALGIRYYAHAQYDAGYEAGHAAAVAAGNAQRDLDTAIHLKKESDLRDQLAAREADAHRKDQEYASNLQAAQRRVLIGVDRLRCPAGPVPASAAAEDRSAAGAPAADGSGPDLMPEAAADVLGYGAAIASLVSRYADVVEQREACRALNEVP